MEPNNETSLFELQVDHAAKDYLRDAAKWAKFLAILGFIWFGFFVAWIFLRLSSQSGVYGPGYTTGYMVVYLALTLLFFFPCFYLLNFSRKMRTALYTNDQDQLNGAFRNLRSSFRFMGIMAVIWLVLVVMGVAFITIVMHRLS